MTHTLSVQDTQVARAAFASILPQADSLALLFYARLFELDPSLRQLFKPDLQDQGHALMTMLQLCIDGLDERAELSFALRNLGARHVTYGARRENYATVQEALLWTMQQGLGDAWNAESEHALRTVLVYFVSEMQRGIPEV